MNSKLPLHAGFILKNEFMVPLNITGSGLSKSIGVSAVLISQIINGKKGITPDTAIRFSKYFGNSPEFWINLQTIYDLKLSLQKNRNIYTRIKPYKYPAEKAS
jgi:addiction module HigA family antidote